MIYIKKTENYIKMIIRVQDSDIHKRKYKEKSKEVV